MKEHLRVQLRSRTLIISGQRRLQDNTWTAFRKEFPVADHSDLNKISAKFEASILYVKLPKSTTQVTNQEEKNPTNPPVMIPKNPTNQENLHKEEAQVKPDSEPTSVTQPNGKHDVRKDDTEKNVNDQKDGELKEPRESASKKKEDGLSSGVVMKLKPWRKDVVKVLVVVVGIVVGVYWTNLIKSWIG